MNAIRYARFMVCLALLVLALSGLRTSNAQGAEELVLFVNNSGQLIVSNSAVSARWIVTNPGEQIVAGGQPDWLPGQRNILYGIQASGMISVRAANITTIVEGILEVGTVTASLAGIAPDGRSALILQNGTYGLQSLTNNTVTPLGLTSEPGGGAPLWSPDSRLVAYWGYQNSTALAVTNAATGASLTFESGFNTPVLPLAWAQDNTSLLFRSASGVWLAEVGCLLGSCAGDELTRAISVLPGTVTTVVVDDNTVYFGDGSMIAAAAFGCAGICTENATVIATDALGGGRFDVADGQLIYTTNTNAVHGVDLACVPSGGCQAQVLVPNARAGALSGSGTSAVVAVNGGISVLDIATRTLTALTDDDRYFELARWNR